jgi:hypothetical protein
MHRPNLGAGALPLFAPLVAAQELQPRSGEPLPGLTPAQLDRFFLGREAFNLPLQVHEGLGPIFNDVSCGACHNRPTIGGSSPRTVTRFGKAAAGGAPFDPLATLGGSLLQAQAISMGCEEIIPIEADVIASRLTPPVFGLGLVETIDDADILALEASQAPGLSGWARMVLPVEDVMGPLRVGRFGWKGGVATALTFSADAAVNEMGLTNEFFASENAPNGDLVLLAACDAVADPEDVPVGGVTRIQRFTDFQRFLAPPPQTPLMGMTGELLFTQIGCASCHHPTYTTGAAPEAALSGVLIRPYSDYLIHDMGALGDGIVDGPVGETQFQTRALWGLRSRSSLLHDGRATGGTLEQNITTAIDEHRGEGQASRDAFFALTVVERNQVLAFLSSLGRPEFDWDGDNDRDEFDWFFLEPLMTGPILSSFTPDHSAAIADVDRDGDFDLVDFAALQRGWTGDL